MSIADDIDNYIHRKKEWGQKQDRLEAAYKLVSAQKKEYDLIVRKREFDIGDLKWTGDTAKDFKDRILQQAMDEARVHYDRIDRVHDGLNNEIKEASKNASYFDCLLTRAYKEIKTGVENVFN